MPLDRPVDFLAVDEIQLCADPERGHVFTARLLHARGRHETMFLGADTIRPLMRRLVPEAEYVSRPRFSTLTYTGHKKVTRLPPRSAVVAFAVADVFALAELMRRQRGGTAVVLGALEPARAQRPGRHVPGRRGRLPGRDRRDRHGPQHGPRPCRLRPRCASSTAAAPRRLTAAEIAQIAGRAGRHMSDGTFGTTAEQGPLDPEIVEAVENHRFDPLTRLFWRNTRLRLRTRSRRCCAASTSGRSVPGLVQAREADDHRALQALARNAEIAALGDHPGAVRLLWEVCQIPDFRKVMSDTHARLLAQIFRHLAGPQRAAADRLGGARRSSRLDRVDGDIDTLMARIAHIRTWTYIAHRADWLDERRRLAGARPRHRGPPVRRAARPHHPALRRSPLGLSGAPARRRRASSSPRSATAARCRSRAPMSAGSTASASCPTTRPRGDESATLLAAANRVLRGEIASRARPLAAAPDGDFALDARPRGALARRRGRPAAAPATRRWRRGSRCCPAIFSKAKLRESVRRRLAAFVRDRDRARGWRRCSAPAMRGSPAPARGLAFQLGEALGSLPAADVAAQRAALDLADRKALARLGVRLRHRVGLYRAGC